MVRERYTRTYIYDDAETDHGFIVSNNSDVGDPKCPPFIPESISTEEVQRIIGDGEIEFGTIFPEEAERYVKDSMLKLFTGKESDWQIISFEVMPGELILKLANPKLCAVWENINSLDLDDPKEIIDVNCVSDDMLRYVYFTLKPVLRASYNYRSLSLNFSNAREDIPGEIDYFKVYIAPLIAEVTESHEISRARRQTNLTFGKEADSSGDKIMIGEIEEIR